MGSELGRLCLVTGFGLAFVGFLFFGFSFLVFLGEGWAASESFGLSGGIGVEAFCVGETPSKSQFDAATRWRVCL